MKGYYTVTVIGRIDGENRTFWFENSIPEIQAVRLSRSFWLSDWHGEPAEIIVKKDEIGG